jgi:hypothetical protein
MTDNYGNRSIATRILESKPYQRGESFTVAQAANKLQVKPESAKGAIHYLLEQRMLVREVVGNLTHYKKPSRHWIHETALAPNPPVCLTERVSIERKVSVVFVPQPNPAQ